MKKLDEDTKRRLEETGSMIVDGRLVTHETPKAKAAVNKATQDKEKSDDEL